MPFLSPLSARRRYALVNFLIWLPSGLMLPTMVLLMLERGLGIAEAGLVSGVYSVVIVALELPTGGLSDVLGRRTILAVSALVKAIGLTAMAFADSFAWFLAAGVLQGVARTLSSGPAQAWYVDTVHAAQGPHADLKPGLARGEASGSVALCLGALAGGFLPHLLPDGGPVEPLAVPMLLGASAAVAQLVVALAAMPEPPRPRPGFAEVLRDVPRTVVTGAHLAVRDRVLARLLVASAAVGVALGVIELLTPARLAELTGAADSGGTVYGVVAALGFAASAAGHALAPWLARVTGGSPRGAMAGCLLTGAALAALAGSVVLDGTAGLAAAAAIYTVLYVGTAAHALLRAEIMHGRVGAERRVTLMSIDSLALQVGAFAGSVGLGALAARAGTGAAWWAGSGVLFLASLLYVRMRAGGPEREEARVELDSVKGAES